MPQHKSPAFIGSEDDDEAALRAEREAEARTFHAEARFICRTLRLARLCPRADCRRADSCRGHPRVCLDTTGQDAPAEVHEWAEQLIVAREHGVPDEQLASEYPVEAAAHRAWVAALAARVKR
jgi:hypothetical protein